jgi:hypothetical protein
MSLVIELHLRARRTDGKRVTSRQLFALATFDDSVKDLFDGGGEEWFEPRGYSGLFLTKWFGGSQGNRDLEKSFRHRLRRDLRRIAGWLRRQPARPFREAAQAGLQLELFVGVYSDEGEWPLRLGPELLAACKDLGLSITTETKITWPAEQNAAPDRGRRTGRARHHGAAGGPGR